MWRETMFVSHWASTIFELFHQIVKILTVLTTFSIHYDHSRIYISLFVTFSTLKTNQRMFFNQCGFSSGLAIVHLNFEVMNTTYWSFRWSGFILVMPTQSPKITKLVLPTVFSPDQFVSLIIEWPTYYINISLKKFVSYYITLNSLLISSSSKIFLQPSSDFNREYKLPSIFNAFLILSSSWHSRIMWEVDMVAPHLGQGSGLEFS